jgi:hypothetical protein
MARSVFQARCGALSAPYRRWRITLFPQYDASKPVALKGVVAKIEWANPHAYIYADIKRRNWQSSAMRS